METAALYNDFAGLAELRHAAGRDAGSNLRTVAAEFEALFLQQALEAMRDATIEGDHISIAILVPHGDGVERAIVVWVTTKMVIRLGNRWEVDLRTKLQLRVVVDNCLKLIVIE